MFVCEGTSVDFKDAGLGGALPSNASYQRLNTEECRAEQCTASRLQIDTADYPSTEREQESNRERVRGR